LTANITAPVFEPLVAFDETWRLQPMLAASYAISADSLTYTFVLRKNVPFHNGKTMGADDVVASLGRWAKASPLGPSVVQHVDSVMAAGNDTVVVKLKAPFAPLLAFLAMGTGGAAIMPREIADAAAMTPVKQYVGTGPYRFVEWKPDQYVRLSRFDQYASRAEPASRFAGRKDAPADDIYYYPVSQVATRVAGVQSGTYDVADGINQDAYADLVKDPRAEAGVVRPGAFLLFFFNKRQGIMANVKVRQAVAAAFDMQPILAATFGNPNLYAVDPSIYPKGTPWYTTTGAQAYNVHDIGRAKQLAKEAGYTGQPIRWLTTQQYDWAFKSTVVAAVQLQRAGFTVDTQVMDWATLLDRRTKPADWDMFVTSHNFAAEPAQITVFSSVYPGWWDTPSKNDLFARFTSETNPASRAQLWAKLQGLFFDEVPAVRPGAFFNVILSRKGLQGFNPSHWTTLWSVQPVG